MAGPDTLKKLLALAENRYHSGAYEDAIKLWEKVLQTDAECGRAREGIKMSKILLQAGGTDLANGPSLSVPGVASGPAEPMAPVSGAPPAPPPDQIDGVGDLKGLLQQNQEAESAIQEHLHSGWQKLQNGDHDGAVQECTEALVLDGSNPDVLKLHQALSGAEPAVAAEVATPAEVAAPVTAPAAAAPKPVEPPAVPTVSDDIIPDLPPVVAPSDSEAAATGDAAISDDLPDLDLVPAAPPAPSAQDVQDVEEKQLIPDALKAGGTKYGQWENEFSELDLDDSEQRVGTGPNADHHPDLDALPNIPLAVEAESGTAAATGDGIPAMPVTPMPTAELADEEIPTTMADSMDGRGAGGEGPEPEFHPPVLTAEKPPASRGGVSGKVVALLGVVLVAAVVGGWFFLRGSVGFTAGRDPAPTGTSGAPSSAEMPPDTLPGPPVKAGPAGPGDSNARTQVEEIQLPQAPAAAPEMTASDIPRPLTDQERAEKVAAMIRSGRDLFEKGRYEQALNILGAALALDPINFELKDILDKVSRKAEEERRASEALDLARRAFDDGDFEIVLRKLYRTSTGVDQEPTRTYIRNTWFNWGLQLLKAGNCREAADKFREAQQLSPDDQEMLKVRAVAERYSQQAKDKIFYAFIEQIHPRPIDRP